jgi:hypothetical protein
MKILVFFMLIFYFAQGISENINSSFALNNITYNTRLEKNFQDLKKVSSETSYDDIAKIIAGIPCSSSSLEKVQNSNVWKSFKKSIDNDWFELEAKRLQFINNWAYIELFAPNKKTELLFYPFGGPDCLTALQFFPNARNYILIGLEPVGNLPDVEKWKPQYMESYLEDLKLSVSDFFKRSYFISKNMNKNLYTDKIDGVLPLICFFLKRNGDKIIYIKRITFDEMGNDLEESYITNVERYKRPYGIKISFSQESSGILKNMYYFSCDISDKSFNKTSKFFLYLEKIDTMTVLIKDASYLLHYNNYTMIRNLILNKSQFILQDDTGIPYRFFKGINWEVKFYGHYTKPVKDFSGVEQPDLANAYKAGNIEKLPFDLGYHWRENADALMLIQRKAK